MYLTVALRRTATITLRFSSSNEEEGAINPDEAGEKESTNTAAKDWYESYYTGTMRASKLLNFLSSHHRADKGIHMPVGHIL